MRTFERLSLQDGSLLSSYAEFIQQYEFASLSCHGKRVIDAGCGSGYGAHCLAMNGATSVLGLDISSAAISEARETYRSDKLQFDQRDIETLGDNISFGGKFDAIVNLGTLPHLPNPSHLINGAKRILPSDGVLVVSTPNGNVNPNYAYHLNPLTEREFVALLSGHFSRVALHGQWLTHQGQLRRLRARELFEQLCDAYYNPMSRVGRAIRKAMGRKVVSAPQNTGNADSFAGDFVIAPLAAAPLPWAPCTLIAVCEN